MGVVVPYEYEGAAELLVDRVQEAGEVLLPGAFPLAFAAVMDQHPEDEPSSFLRRPVLADLEGHRNPDWRVATPTRTQSPKELLTLSR